MKASMMYIYSTHNRFFVPGNWHYRFFLDTLEPLNKSSCRANLSLFIYLLGGRAEGAVDWAVDWAEAGM